MSTVEIVERAEWLAWRAGGLGASDVAAVVRLSPWVSRWSLWADKVGLLPDGGQDETEQMEFGRRFEPVAAAWFPERCPGLYVAGEQTWCTHRDLSWARCTVDGFVYENQAEHNPERDAALGTFETKVDFRHGIEAWAESVPAHYQCQAQWQMHVTGTDRCWFGVLHPFGRFHVYELARDDTDIALLRREAERFWFDHVVAGEPPEVDGSDATTDALKAAWPDPAGTVELDRDLVATTRTLRAQRDMAKDAADEADNRVRAALGEHTDGTVDGLVVASWRPQTSNKIDPALVRSLHPEIAAEVTKSTTSRVLRLHDPK